MYLTLIWLVLAPWPSYLSMYLTLIWLVLAPWPFLSVYVSYPDLNGFSSLAVPICLCILHWFDWFQLPDRSYLSMYLTLIWVVSAPWPFLSVYVSYPDLSGFSSLAVPTRSRAIRCFTIILRVLVWSISSLIMLSTGSPPKTHTYM